MKANSQRIVWNVPQIRWLFLLLGVFESGLERLLIFPSALLFVLLHFLFCADDAMQTKMSPSAAREILQNYSPKPIGTCRANNKVAIDYDLQIIVPCYNVEKYIRQCLDSILKQRTNYRVLISIVNDGSTDGTADILQQLLWEANTEKMMGGGTLLS